MGLSINFDSFWLPNEFDAHKFISNMFVNEFQCFLIT